MANRFPLIANPTTQRIEELKAGDNLDLTLSGIWDGTSYGTLGQVLKSNGTGSVVWGDAAASDTNTTYSVSAADGPPGKKLIRLVGSDAVIDTVSIVAGTNVSVTRADDDIIISSTAGGDVTKAASSTDKAIVRFSGTTGGVIQNSTVTISDTGAIVAPSAGSIIPFYFHTLADLPSPSTYHGAIAHAHDTGRMYYAHGNEWISLANSSEVQVSSRANFQTITGSITNGTTVTADITNAYKSYLLFKITTSRGAWVRVYTSKAARTADASRAIDVDPLPGSGVIAEVITTGSTNQTQLLTPATIGFNDEATPVNEIYLTITNRSGTTGAVTVTLTALKLEA